MLTYCLEPYHTIEEASPVPREWKPASNTRCGAPGQADSGRGRGATASIRADVVAGAKAIAPVLPAGAVVGLVTGVAADAVGLAPVRATAMSYFVYSPTVMLTAFTLHESGTPAVVLVVASLVVALRFAMLSASIAPYFSRFSVSWRWVLAYFLWTPVYALSIDRFDAESATSRRGYYLGAAFPLWVTFQVAVLVGLVFGARVPARWQLRFVVPLAFIALLVRFSTDRPRKLAALIAGTLAVVGGGLPLNGGIVLAALGGTIAGAILDSQGGNQ